MKTLCRDKLYKMPTHLSNSSGWQTRHFGAITAPKSEFEKALVEMLSGWLRYAASHAQQYESGIGEDGVLGAYWAQIGAGLRGLLNGELGRFDGGTLDSVLAGTLEEQNVDPDQL
jgi:hypothetical protein